MNFELNTDRTNETEGHREKKNKKRQPKTKKKKREVERKNDTLHNLYFC